MNTPLLILLPLSVAFVAVVVMALLKSGSDADDAAEEWSKVPDLHAERRVRRTRVVARNRG